MDKVADSREVLVIILVGDIQFRVGARDFVDDVLPHQGVAAGDFLGVHAEARQQRLP